MTGRAGTGAGAGTARWTEVVQALDALADPVDAANLSRFFKTGAGEYGEGDVFTGVRVPAIRRVASQFRDLDLGEVALLLDSPIHEHRLCALLVLTLKAQRANHPDRGDAAAAASLAEFYRDAVRRGRVNNWDLVDSSAEYVLGEYLYQSAVPVPSELIASSSLWERRVGVLATFAFLKHGDASETRRVADLLVSDRADLIQKAVGWMLREAGKRCGRSVLTDFLDGHASAMGSVALSYATEHLDAEQRSHYRELRRAAARRR